MAIRSHSLNYRQKTLVKLLSVLGGQVTRRDFQKYLFLFTKEFQTEPDFEFVPYKYGCFSFQSYADKRRLVEVGVLQNVEDWLLTSSTGANQFEFDNNRISDFYNRYSHLKGKALIREVYRRYPYYAINSEIAGNLMADDEIEKIDEARPQENEECFFTIGYEGSSFEGYLNRLIKNDVKTLVDVRRNPLSRKYGFSKKTLSGTVEKLGIEYLHFPELGISSEKRQQLVTQADYDRLFSSYEKHELKKNQSALDNLVKVVADRKRVAITCFEAQVCMCHRSRIARAISNAPGWDYDIRHI